MYEIVIFALCAMAYCDSLFLYDIVPKRRVVMENLSFTAEILHKHRAHELQEEARIEHFLNERKQREAKSWMQRRLHRHRKTR